MKKSRPYITRIYIAAKFSDRTRLRSLLPSLKVNGFEVTSRWITDDDKDFHEITEGELLAIAHRDVDDIHRADYVVLDTINPLSDGAGGGREFEAGIGLIYHGLFVRVGPARNPFHYKAEWSAESWGEFIYG